MVRVANGLFLCTHQTLTALKLFGVAVFGGLSFTTYVTGWEKLHALRRSSEWKTRKHSVERFDIQQFETDLVKQGYLRIAGVDEAGRGALAGPVVAAAVILPPGCELSGLADSKQLTSAQREVFFARIEKDAIGVGVGIVEHQIIDQINILQATMLAMQKAVESIIPPPDYVLVDGNQLPLVQMSGRAVIKGDSLVQSIAAASVMAKVTRDRIMVAFDVEYPGFGFKKHKGYGTLQHRQAIMELDPCLIHRTSFKLT